MKLEEIVRAAHAAAKDTKEAKLKDSTKNDPESVELLSMLDGFRDGESVVHALMLEADFGSIMQAVKVLASGFGCDAIVLINESFHANTAENPLTGKRWEHGEMQDLARNHDGVSRGFIRESLGCMAVNRAGDIAHLLQDFNAGFVPIDLEGEVGSWSLEWGDETYMSTTDEGKDAATLTGRFPETMIALMNEPTLLQEAMAMGMGPDQFGMGTSPEDQEAVQAHIDCAVVRAVSGMGLISAALMLQAQTGSVRAHILEESLSELPNVLTPEEMAERFAPNPDAPPA